MFRVKFLYLRGPKVFAGGKNSTCLFLVSYAMRAVLLCDFVAQGPASGAEALESVFRYSPAVSVMLLY